MKKCQDAYEKADRACSQILDIYEYMTEKEQWAFDLGESYRDMHDARNELAELIVNWRGEDEDDTAGI